MWNWLRRKLRHWVFRHDGDLPLFYAVVTVDLLGPARFQVLETTRSIHRARGIARERRASEKTSITERQYIVTYYPGDATQEF